MVATYKTTNCCLNVLLNFNSFGGFLERGTNGSEGMDSQTTFFQGFLVRSIDMLGFFFFSSRLVMKEE